MSNLAELASHDFQVSLPDGTELTFRPFSINMWCEFQAWINKQEDAKPQQLRTFEQMMEAVQSVSGMRWVVWRSAKDNHPKLTLDDIGSRVPMTTVVEILPQIMAMGETAEGNEAAPATPRLTG